MGIDQLKVIVKSVADAITVSSKIIVDHAGFLAALELMPDVQAIGALSQVELLAEVKGLNPDERAQLDALFAANLVLSNVSLQAKIDAGELDLEKGIDLAFSALACYNVGKALVADVQSLFA